MKLIFKQGNRVTGFWVVFLIGFFSLAGYLASEKMYTDKLETLTRHQERISPLKTESGRTQVDITKLMADKNADYNEVNVGVYVDRIVDVSTKATGWTVDFYIWFKWDNADIDPGQSFQVVNGEMLSKTLIVKSEKNNVHYAQYRVIARITKFFNIVRYPHDNHMLTIRIEDRENAWDTLRYLPDKNDSGYSSRVKVPGYALNNAELISKLHAYKSTRGDPRFTDGSKVIFSQLTYGIKIQRPDWGLYFKMFQGLFASVAIAIMTFLFRPKSGERIGLGVGAFFAAVASSYINLSELPGVGLVTLTDIVNGLGLTIIFLTILGSIISSRIADKSDQVEIALKFDRYSLVIFSIGFVSINTTMALLASV